MIPAVDWWSRAVVWKVLACALVTAGMELALPAGASASVIWRLDSNTAPTYLTPGQPGRVIATADNLGDIRVQDAGAHPVVISDRLPAHLRVPAGAQIEGKLEASDRSEAASALDCTVEEPARKTVSCETGASTQPIVPYSQLRVTIPVETGAEALSGEENTVTLSGGEAGGEALSLTPSLSRPLTVKDQPTPFGVARYQLTAEQEDGSVDSEAGSHPFQLTTTLDLNEALAPEGAQQPLLEPTAAALARNLSFQLPPGLLGDPQAVAQCPDVDFASIGENNANACPADTAVGVALVTLNLPFPPLAVFTEAVPVFNLVPAPGEPARFGLEDTKVPVILDTQVRTSGDYGVTVTVKNTTEVAQLLSTIVTLWGQPASPSHDASRGWACVRQQEVNGEACSAPAERSSTPFLTLPTACDGALATLVDGESWDRETAEAQYTFKDSLEEPLAQLEGCEGLPFEPTLETTPVDEQAGQQPVTSASTAVGMNVNVRLPVEAGGLGEAAVEDTTVSLPAGVQLNPAAANGLNACSEAQIGYEGENASPDPLAPGTALPPVFSGAPVACPEPSKIGTVRIRTPDLAHELVGGVYVAQSAPNGETGKNPFDSLLALYIAAEDPVSKILVKLAGQVSLNQETGQITSTFNRTPQVPFEELHIHFFEGPRASLTTPAQCGTYTTQALFTPWSGSPPVAASAGLQINAGPGGAACADPLAFAPTLTAGVENPQAGAFTQFALTIKHPDGNQPLHTISVQLPAGIAAILADVTPCPEPQAAQGQCGPESLIGSSTALAGLGSEPVSLPGQVYLTGPYQNAPFGIEDITPAVAGPFDLGNVIVRSTIKVNPHTAAVSITSDPIPTIIKGVPAQIKELNITVNRPKFQFNPTNCEPKHIQTTLTGIEGASTGASSPFQVTGCKNLPFHPGVNATTQGTTSKANGASLALTFRSKAGEAHVAKTILTIPAILPARLTTIQKACVASVFEANPAACPEGSDIGTATVHTPVLKNPVAGPIYLVSHGNAAWPDAELVLQGEGIKVILDGQTAIKKGVTTSSFLSIPDVPFESVQATLPEGPHSALTTNLPLKDHYSLCGQHLTIPTALAGQNGTAVDESVKVTVHGCQAVKASRTRRLTRKQKLTRALDACRNRNRHSRTKRGGCERAARARYELAKRTRKT